MIAPKLLLALCVLLLSGAGDVWADRGHGRVGVGVYIGGPVVRPYYPGYYGRPYYYSRPYYAPRPYFWGDPFYTAPAPVVVMPSTPPVYVERTDAGPAAGDGAQYWYYCAGAQGYYPYVKDCPGGWQRVLPQPAQ